MAGLVGEMGSDLDAGGAAEWENATLGRFLEALSACLESEPCEPTWASFARILVTATGYE